LEHTGKVDMQVPKLYGVFTVSVFISLCILLNPCFASPVTEGYLDIGDFVRGGIGAKSLSMAGSYVAVSNDSSAGFWNPAGLTYLDGICLGGMHTDRFSQGISFQYLSLLGKYELDSLNGLKVPGNLGAGVTFINMDTGEMTLLGGSGTFGESRSVLVGSLAYGFNTGEQAIFDSLSFGVNVKYYTRKYGDSWADGIGFDLALMVRKKLKVVEFSFGFASQDISDTNLNWKTTQMGMPSGMVPWFHRLGIAVKFPNDNFLISAEYDFSPTDSLFKVIRAGIQIAPVDQLKLRGGIRKWPGVKGLDYMMGMGIELDPLTVNYAYQPNQVLGDTHILSADFAF